MFGLRVALLAALTQQAGGVYATIAGPRIYDSRPGELDPETEGYQPSVVMSVEARKGETQSSQNGGAPHVHVADVVFALHIFSRADVAVDGGGLEPGVVIAETDVEAEDLLDILEAQVKYAAENSAVVDRFVARWSTAFEVEPYRDDAGIRYATRALKISCELVQESLGNLSWLAARPGLAGDLAARLATATTHLTAAAAVVDGSAYPLEGVEALLVKDRPLPPVPDADTLPFLGM